MAETCRREAASAGIARGCCTRGRLLLLCDDGALNRRRGIASDAIVDICTPADGDGTAPQPLDSYDGVAITGSSLNIYQRDIASLRQIDFVREVFARGIPMFGSCWGLQLATVAAGGEVGLNPAGREVAFARKIALTPAGSVPTHR